MYSNGFQTNVATFIHYFINYYYTAIFINYFLENTSVKKISNYVALLLVLKEKQGKSFVTTKFHKALRTLGKGYGALVVGLYGCFNTGRGNLVKQSIQATTSCQNRENRFGVENFNPIPFPKATVLFHHSSYL